MRRYGRLFATLGVLVTLPMALLQAEEPAGDDEPGDCFDCRDEFTTWPNKQHWFGSGSGEATERMNRPYRIHSEKLAGACTSSYHSSCGNMLISVDEVIQRAAVTGMLAAEFETTLGGSWVYNANRNALQLYDCGGAGIIAHVPLGTEMITTII
jgi:hypothetical protein